MWGRRSSSKISKIPREEEVLENIQRSFSVNEEYLHAFRTQSYVELFTKAHLLVNETSSSPRSSTNNMEILLEPEHHSLSPILEAFSNESSDLKHLLLQYFDTSAQAARACSKLLRSIKETQTNYRLIQRALQRFSQYSPDQYNSAISELDSLSCLKNPFSDPTPEDIKLICGQLSSILHCFNSKRKQVARRIKLINFIKKATGVCLTAACSVVALVAVGIAVHSIPGLLMGTALLGLSPFHVNKKFSSLNWFRCRTLRKLRQKLDVAAKGTYILNRDFDTMSRIVVRLHDEVEHKKEMIRFCLERREDKFPLQEVVKELRKNGRGFNKQVHELEEHVCLCLLTINRARGLVMKEMSQT